MCMYTIDYCILLYMEPTSRNSICLIDSDRKQPKAQNESCITSISKHIIYTTPHFVLTITESASFAFKWTHFTSSSFLFGSFMLCCYFCSSTLSVTTAFMWINVLYIYMCVCVCIINVTCIRRA